MRMRIDLNRLRVFDQAETWGLGRYLFQDTTSEVQMCWYLGELLGLVPTASRSVYSSFILTIIFLSLLQYSTVYTSSPHTMHLSYDPMYTWYFLQFYIYMHCRPACPPIIPQQKSSLARATGSSTPNPEAKSKTKSSPKDMKEQLLGRWIQISH